MTASPLPPQVPAPQVAREVDRFVESILLTVEDRVGSVLAAEDLSFEDARALINLTRDRRLIDDGHGPPKLDRRQRRRIRRLVERGLAETPDEEVALSGRGRILLGRLEAVRYEAIVDLVAGLEPADQLRLQGAMRLVSGRFGGRDGLWV